MLEIKSISKRYTSGRGHITALQDISLVIDAKRSHVLAGKSGSGKTSLLNCLGALEKPDSGQILYQGKDLCQMTGRERILFQRREVGFVFQASNLLPWLTVGENLMLPLALNGYARKDQQHRISSLLESFGLEGFEKAMPGELSGGETQRVAFARAIAHHPKLLLADEPTASLDSATGLQLIRHMLFLAEHEGTTLLTTSHDPELINLMEKRFYLKDGRLEESL